ncbi:NitT/TauT family transport system ATP-binding protein [Tindallia magadiensis]|uniref:NitT/TauT family transport system ATP-binding protein n=1 Tax=Tindallia magadiensis TaxID=69895 RepID=A0A1I3EL70_9FIRM|nr:ABC transporter ATP-binding protein [Tindallia magadiensis]SFH99726.1 NitT/TauT family transport system ATP-binding protein [Tindallia magadiensis]
MESSVLKADKIRKKYISEKGFSVTAIEDFSLSVSENEFVSILGPSGCGKSTFLRMVAGLENGNEGSLTYKDKAIKKQHPEIGMVFQDYSLLPWRTVLDNVVLGLEFEGINKKTRYEEGMKYLKIVGLEKFSQAYPYELSGGMQQRVAMVRSLVKKPSLLLMDEPFGALDAHTRMILQKELLDIWEKDKKTILFVTHSVDEAIYLSDRVIVMSGSPGTVKEVIPVELPRPRDRGDASYGKLLSLLIRMLGEEYNKVKTA